MPLYFRLLILLKKNLLFVKKIIKDLKKSKTKIYKKLSYSQYGEDVVLKSFYEKTPEYKGFYIDIGAYHPLKYSNTQIFYKNGWTGINIDATPKSMIPFNKFRKRDINLECAVSDKEETLTYYSFKENALSTFDEQLGEERIKQGWKLNKKFKLKTKTINQILSEYLPENQKIDFIDIDIEGFELKILKTFDFSKFAPDYFLIEDLDTVSEDLFRIQKSELNQFMQLHGYIAVAKTMKTIIFKKRNLELSKLKSISNKKWENFVKIIQKYHPYLLLNKEFKARLNNIKKISIQTNNQCNYSHIHKECPIHYFKQKEELETDAIYRLLDELGEENYENIIQFSVYNEPLVDSRFYDFCNYSKKVCPNCKIYLITNGALLKTDDDIKKLENAGVDYLHISAYSVEEYNRLKKLSVNIAYIIEPTILDNRMNLGTRKYKISQKPCYSVFADLCISSKGDVFLCCLDYNNSITYGNIYNQSLKEIINSEKLKEDYIKLSSNNRTYEICKKCNWSRY